MGAGTYAWLRAQGLEVDPPVPGNDLVAKPVKALKGVAFDVNAVAILQHVVLELLPGDPSFGLPSGVESGVVDYLLAACKDPGLLSVRNEILKLTRHLDIIAKKQGDRFVALAPEVRSRIVREVSQDDGGKRRFDPSRALKVCLRLSLEGYLGHSFHGGNKDHKVWDAFDISMPRDRSPGHSHS